MFVNEGVIHKRWLIGQKPDAKKGSKPVMVFSEIDRLCSAVGASQKPTAKRKDGKPLEGVGKGSRNNKVNPITGWESNNLKCAVNEVHGRKAKHP
jgi:hypothetical protein